MGDGMSHIQRRQYFPGDVGFADERQKEQVKKPVKKTPKGQWHPDEHASDIEHEAYIYVMQLIPAYVLPLGRLSAKVTDGLLRGVLALTGKTPEYLIERLRGIRERAASLRQA